MQYIYTNEVGEKIPAEVERWAWGVIYEDGELKQFGDDGVFHRIGEVDNERVSLFVLYKLDDPSKRIDILLPRGAKVIHKYRNIVENHGTDEEKTHRVYVIGWKLGDRHLFNFVLPDDRIVQAERDDIDLLKFNL